MPYAYVVAVGESLSPYAHAYSWTYNAIGTKYSNPGSLPGGAANKVVFSANGEACAVAHNSGVYISVYPWNSNGFGTKFSAPATTPTGNANAVAFTAASDYLACAHSTSPYVSVYPWSSSGFGTKISDPGTAVAGTGNGVAFSPSGDYIAIAHNTSPYLTVYPWSGSGFGTKVSDPGSLPSNVCLGVAFSPSGSSILATNQTTAPYLNGYPWSAGFGSKFTAPSTNPAGTCRSFCFSSDGKVIFAPHSNTPYVTAYPYGDATGYGAKYTNPGTAVAGTGQTCAFINNDPAIAVAHATSPYFSIYPWTNTDGFGTKLSDPASLPGSTGNGVAFGRFSIVAISGTHYYSITLSSASSTPYDDVDWAEAQRGDSNNGVYAQAGLTSANTGVKYPYGLTTTSATAPYDDNDWINLTNLYGAGVAGISSGFALNEYSFLLKAQNFGFSIPTTATVTGVEVVINRYHSGASSGAVDGVLKLLDSNGDMTGTDQASASAWPTTAADATYGGSTSLWGATVSPSLVNSDNFGVGFSIKSTGTTTNAYVDYITMKVYYDLSATFNNGQYSYLLKAANFLFAVPSDATILGIEVKVDRKCSAGAVKDAIVKLIGAAGTLVGNDKADTVTSWPASDTVATYGGSADLWGATLTPTDVNDADFGVAIAITATSNSSVGLVDYISMSVTYALPSGIKTVHGVAKASVKTIHGLAIASVKTLQGLA